MNTCYKHFYYFVSEFSLVDKKELEPLVCIQFTAFHTFLITACDGALKISIVNHKRTSRD